MTKVVRLGTAKTWEDGRYMSIFCRIEFKNGRLSISGVEGPLPSGNCLGSCGQIDMHLKPGEIKLAPGWTREKLEQFLAVWKQWHLNDMVAGSPRQEQWLRDNPVKFEYPESHYTAATIALNHAGLNPDTEYLHEGQPYKYGSAWLRKEVPADVIAFLESLPDTDKQPAWV